MLSSWLVLLIGCLLGVAATQKDSAPMHGMVRREWLQSGIRLREPVRLGHKKSSEEPEEEEEEEDIKRMLDVQRESSARLGKRFMHYRVLKNNKIYKLLGKRQRNFKAGATLGKWRIAGARLGKRITPHARTYKRRTAGARLG